MCAALEALAPFKVAVRGRGAALMRLQPVVVHGQAHRTARLAPVETRLDEDLVETLVLSLLLHQPGPRHDHRVDGRRDFPALDHLGDGAQILDAAIGAGADEDAVERDVGYFRAWL